MFRRNKESDEPMFEIENETDDPLQAEILEFLQNVRFKRKFFGGVDEADVWRKISELNSLYERAALLRQDVMEDEDA